MKTTQEHLTPQAAHTEIRDSQSALDHRKGVLKMVRDLVQPFLAIRTFVQKHPDFDPDDLVIRWQRVLRMTSRFDPSIGLELAAIQGGPFGPEADPDPLPPLVPDTSKDPRIQAVQFITTMAGHAEDLLQYLQENPDSFSPAVAMNKIVRISLTLKRDAPALQTVVQNLVPGRDPWGES